MVAPFTIARPTNISSKNILPGTKLYPSSIRVHLSYVGVGFDSVIGSRKYHSTFPRL
jgi:hypothetical protein